MPSKTDMATKQESEWSVVLQDWHGIKFAPETVDRWEKWLANEANADPLQIKDALLWASKTQDYKFKNKVPTVAELIMIVRWWRKDRATAMRGGALSQGDPEGLYRMIWGKVLDARTDEERWNYCCNPKHYLGTDQDMTTEQKEKMIAEIYRRWPNFKKPVFDWAFPPRGMYEVPV